jgi:hypothetical protein
MPGCFDLGESPAKQGLDGHDENKMNTNRMANGLN